MLAGDGDRGATCAAPESVDGQVECLLVVVYLRVAAAAAAGFTLLAKVVGCLTDWLPV